MRSRRGRGEGSIFRRKDGVWAGILSLGYGGDGRRYRRVVYGHDKSMVVERLARMRAQALDGMLSDAQRLTVSTFLARWLEDVARPAVSPSTHQLYKGLIRLHINPRIGAVPLSRLTPVHAQGMLATMERYGASPRLRQMALGVLHRALGQAVRWSMVPRNICDAVTRPRVPRETMRALTTDQVTRLFGTAKGDRLEALYVLAVTTGLRQGELLGLQWDDIDLPGAVLRVQHTLHELNGRLWVGEPKTKRGRRQVDLPAVAVVALQTHRERMLVEGRSDGLVFSDTQGGPLRKSNLLRRSFLPLLKRAGLPTIRFHDLRHTAATLLLAQGVHPKIVQERLGHSQISLTLDTYSHVLPGMGREAASKIDALLAKPAIIKDGDTEIAPKVLKER